MILADALSRGFANGCTVWVDVTGRLLGADLVHTRAGGTPSRRHNPKWQADVGSYLRGGDVILILRQPLTGLAPATLAAIASHGLLLGGKRFSVYRTVEGTRRD